MDYEFSSEETEQEQVDEISNEEKQIYLEVLTFVIVLCGLVALLTILVIIRFKRLIALFHYKFILNWCIITAVSYLSCPIIFRVLGMYFHYHIFTLIVLTFFVSVIVNWCIVTLMAVDYLLESHFYKSSLKFRKGINLILAATYGLGVILVSFLFYVYVKGHPFLILFFLWIFIVVFYSICILTYLTVLTIHSIKLYKNRGLKKKTNVPLIFTGIFLLLWFLLFVSGILHTEYDDHVIWGRFTMITLMLALLNPILLIAILFKMDHSFAASFIQTVKCQRSDCDDEVDKLCFDDSKVTFDAKEEHLNVVAV